MTGADGAAWGGDVRGGVLALFFDLAAWRPWLGDAVLLLDDTECERARCKHRASDRDDLALTYALHRLVLARVLECDPGAVALGRPCLADGTLQTSLSHADGFVAVAVGQGALGIDLELASRAATMQTIADQVCHPDEARSLAGLDDAGRGLALLRLWVRKEALLKAAGIGLSREMPSFVAPTDQPLALPLADGGDDGDGPEKVVIRVLDVGPLWLAALATSDHGMPCLGWLRPPFS